jgi:hypothetical protein
MLVYGFKKHFDISDASEYTQYKVMEWEAFSCMGVTLTDSKNITNTPNLK